MNPALGLPRRLSMDRYEMQDLVTNPDDQLVIGATLQQHCVHKAVFL